MRAPMRAARTVDETIATIADGFEGLSGQLKKIAVYIDKNRDSIGIEGIRVFAQECDVHPSTVVRFAQHFGFKGFRELQSVFRDNLSRQLDPDRSSYQERIRELVNKDTEPQSNIDIAKAFLAGSLAGMQALESSLDAETFRRSVDLLRRSDCIWVAASRRSFPVAAYLDYALQHTNKRVITVNAVESTRLGQNQSVRGGDVMIAISFAPYAQETLFVARQAVERGVNLIAITDSVLSPLAQSAKEVLVVQEGSTHGFRSLSSTMGLAQSLFIAAAYSMECPAIA